MKAYITSRSYCVPLTPVQWEKLNAINKRGDDRWEKVSATLTRLGAERIEYNGHFGRNIFFTLEKARHLTRVLKAVQKFVT